MRLCFKTSIHYEWNSAWVSFCKNSPLMYSARLSALLRQILPLLFCQRFIRFLLNKGAFMGNSPALRVKGQAVLCGVQIRKGTFVIFV